MYVVYSIVKATNVCEQLLYDDKTRRFEWCANGTHFEDLHSVSAVVSPMIKDWASHSRSVPCIKWLPDGSSNADVAKAAPTSYVA